MSGERQLGRRREDPDVGVGSSAASAADHEHRLGQVQLAGGALHDLGAEIARVGEHRHRVALQRRVGEHVDDDVMVHYSSAISSSVVTVVQLRAVAVTPRPLPASLFHSFERATPSGCQA